VRVWVGGFLSALNVPLVATTFSCICHFHRVLLSVWNVAAQRLVLLSHIAANDIHARMTAARATTMVVLSWLHEALMSSAPLPLGWPSDLCVLSNLLLLL